LEVVDTPLYPLKADLFVEEMSLDPLGDLTGWLGRHCDASM
jgi:hypothetical protein